jgi:hypothetical protein
LPNNEVASALAEELASALAALFVIFRENGHPVLMVAFTLPSKDVDMYRVQLALNPEIPEDTLLDAVEAEITARKNRLKQ